MSISLPNGTLLANPATQTQYTAAVTRILHLSSFPAELKTRDLQLMFKDFEGEKGGFRIKWRDDVNALVVFADAGVAKRAYLSFLLSPPANFPHPAQIRPYDKPDAAQIIQALSARAMGHRSSMSSAMMSSGNAFGGGAQTSIDGLPSHHRTGSMGMGSSTGANGVAGSSSGGVAGSSGMGSFAFPIKSSSRTSLSLGSRSHGRSGSSSFSRQSGSGLGALNFGAGSGGPGGLGGPGPGSGVSSHSSGAISSTISGLGRLPTHAESLDSPARPSAPFPVRRTTKESEMSRSASSSDTEPIVVMDQAPVPLPAVPGFGGWKMPSKAQPQTQHPVGAAGHGVRRESISAEKALREVEKALAGVEAR